MRLFVKKFDTIDSTHDWAKKTIHLLPSDAFTCISALEQTHGHGRHHRHWLSPRGLNIYATLCFHLLKTIPWIANLGQLLSLSIASFLEKNGLTPEIKWPNDIRVQEKKIAGILCDVIPQNQTNAIVLSMGFNVNMPEQLLATIDQSATSLAHLTGYTWDIDAVLDSLLHTFISDLTVWQETGFSAFKERYEQLLAFKGQPIRCTQGKETIEGICHAILPDGRLELLLPSGAKLHLSSGEII